MATYKGPTTLRGKLQKVHLPGFSRSVRSGDPATKLLGTALEATTHNASRPTSSCDQMSTNGHAAVKPVVRRRSTGNISNIAPPDTSKHQRSVVQAWHSWRKRAVLPTSRRTEHGVAPPSRTTRADTLDFFRDNQQYLSTYGIRPPAKEGAIRKFFRRSSTDGF